MVKKKAVKKKKSTTKKVKKVASPIISKVEEDQPQEPSPVEKKEDPSPNEPTPTEPTSDEKPLPEEQPKDPSSDPTPEPPKEEPQPSTDPPSNDSPQNQALSHDKQFYWVIGVMAGLIAVFLISSSVVESMKSFDYEGLTFTKEKFGDIPVFRYYYYTDPSPITGQAISDPFLINVFLREDPRLNTVPVIGEISFRDRKKYIFITTETEGLEECEYTAVGLSSMTSFLASNGYTVKGAIPDKELAKETGLRFTDCEDRPTNTVIEVRAGEESKIELVAPNCYEMTINNCESLAVTEKFIVQAIIDGKAKQNIPGN